MSKFAWVTLTTNDTYSLGALVLAHSLRRTGTAHQLAVLVSVGVSESMRDRLREVYDVVQEVNVLDSGDAANLALLARPELGITFTKLHCWRLVQFEKCVFLDADTLVLQNCDELFEREEFSAAPDVSWPDCFNSGVFVYRPSAETFAKITEFAVKHGSFDGGDQGLLNSYFADWAHKDIAKHLPFIYNVTAYASYCYLPAFKQFRDKIKILHFAGKMKPWLIQFNSQSKSACTPTDYAHANDLIQMWWNIFCDNVHHNLTDNMNYWPAITQWSYYEQNYNNNNNHVQYDQQQERYHNHQEQEHHDHHHDQKEQANERNHFQFDCDNIKEYRDPWEDYYKKLESQVHEDPQQDLHQQQSQQEQQQREQQEHEQQQHQHQQHEIIHEIRYEEIVGRAKVEEYHSQSNECFISIETPRDESVGGVQCETPREALRLEAEPLDTSACSTNATDIRTSNEPPTESYESIHKTQLNTAINEEEEEEEKEEEEEDLLVVNNEVNLDSKTQTSSEAQLSDENDEAGLAGALSQLRLGEKRTPEQEAYEQLMRRQCWESGQIDYAGKDSFDNIWERITQTMGAGPTASAPAAAAAKDLEQPKPDQTDSGSS